MQLSPLVQALFDVFETPTHIAKEARAFAVSRTVSTFAVIYEKARNAVEFRAEHLVRRAAIERILKRRTTLGNDPRAIAENLTVELLWAKYIDSSLIDDDTIATIAQIIGKYLIVKNHIQATRHKGITWEMVAGIASAEIDEIMVSPTKREALVNFVYQLVRPKILIPSYNEELLNMMTYIAVERAYAQSDEALITFHLLKMIDSDWTKRTTSDAEEHIEQLFTSIQHISQSSKNALTVSIAKYLRKQLPPFLLLRDFMFEHEKDARSIVEDETKFEETLNILASKRYEQIGVKVRRGIVRSIVYIFLTKMILAILLEVPVDTWITKKIDWIPLLINLIFPPVLLALIASFISVPGPDNTKRLIDRIKTIVYHPESYQKASDAFTLTPKRKRPLLSAVFSLFYVSAFALTFGFIGYILSILHFNFASQIIFVFFVALVSLFAYRIRQSAREYEVVERQGILEPLMDFFFLPILYAGDLLSKEIAKINFFIFLFDFILEAPLKVIFEVVEEWIRFIRTKKEEII